MQVRAAYARSQNTPIAVETFDLDGPREGEVLIELEAAGLCHSDMSFFNGSRDWSDYPIVLGHEGAGIVLDLGRGVQSVSAGDHVIPVAIPECGTCPRVPARNHQSLRFLFSADEPAAVPVEGSADARVL